MRRVEELGAGAEMVVWLAMLRALKAKKYWSIKTGAARDTEVKRELTVSRGDQQRTFMQSWND